MADERASVPRRDSVGREWRAADWFVRFGWMFGGNVVLIVAALTILRTPRFTFGVRDVVYWSAVVATIALRFVDVTRLEGRRADGAPASRRDLARYVAGLTLVALGIWTGAQSIQL